MHRIATLNPADIETVVGGIGSSLMADAISVPKLPRETPPQMPPTQTQMQPHTPRPRPSIPHA
ncbi:MAG: hypothetical protein U1E23_00475 [Reyranellaceae bacterium]